MGRRCSKGKACGATCISRVKVCLKGLNNDVSLGMGKLKGLLGEGEEVKNPQDEVKSAPPRDKEVKEKTNSEIVEETFTGSKGAKFLGNLLDDLEEPLKGEFSQEEIKNLAYSHYKQSREFMRKLEKGLPPETKMTVDDKNIIHLNSKTKSGDSVEVTYSPKTGFHFKVNGSYDAGSVKTKEGELQVTLMIRSLFRNTISSLPKGSILHTAAYEEDGKGEKRREIYTKLGFNAPDDKGNMYGKVGSGRRTLRPSNHYFWVEQPRTSDSVFFSEDSSDYSDSNVYLGSIQDWYQIIFGKSMK